MDQARSWPARRLPLVGTRSPLGWISVCGNDQDWCAVRPAVLVRKAGPFKTSLEQFVRAEVVDGLVRAVSASDRHLRSTRRRRHDLGSADPLNRRVRSAQRNLFESRLSLETESWSLNREQVNRRSGVFVFKIESPDLFSSC